MRTPGNALVVCLPVIVLTALSCGDRPDPSEPELAEDLGRPLTGADEAATRLVWPGDGRELFYTSATAGPQWSYRIKALGLSVTAPRVPRLVDERHVPYDGLTASPDGTWLYVAAAPDELGYDAPALYAVASDGNESKLLATDVVGLPVPAGSYGASGRVVASPDNVRVAYMSRQCSEASCQEPSFVHQVVADERVLLGSATPVAFSPDGRRLLIYEGSIITLDTGERESASLGPGSSSAWPLLTMVRWDASGIRVLYWDSPDRSGFVYDVARNTRTELTFELRQDEWLVEPGQAWSPDGRRIAFWGRSGGCILLSCTEVRSTLHVVYTDGRGDEIVAVAYDRDGGSVAFSPDGRSIAYVLSGQIFVKELL